MITIVDYGIGNIRALANIFKFHHIDFNFAKTPQELSHAEKIILPGVGAFDFAMQKLEDSGMKQALDEMVLTKKTPILGICVGMQILANGSEEGKKNGLGYIPGFVKKLNPSQEILPHMGWNNVEFNTDNQLFTGISASEKFYFLHSFHFVPENKEDVLAKTFYGEEIISAVQKDHIFGVQFHPEKSHANGEKILVNFSNL